MRGPLTLLPFETCFECSYIIGHYDTRASRWSACARCSFTPFRPSPTGKRSDHHPAHPWRSRDKAWNLG